MSVAHNSRRVQLRATAGQRLSVRNPEESVLSRAPQREERREGNVERPEEGNEMNRRRDGTRVEILIVLVVEIFGYHC